MILDSIPSIPASSAPAGPAPSGRSAASPAAPSGAAYARVRNEVETARRNNPPASPPSTQVAKGASLWQNGSFGFGDFIDVVNPLQHIPIVATLYRNLSGDHIGMASRVIGGALWGRIGGFVAGIINSAVEWFTGKDIGDHVYAAIRGQPDADAVAQAQPAKSRTSAPGVIDATPTDIPLSGPDQARGDRERHSVLSPSPRLLSPIDLSYFRRDDEDDSVGAKPPAIRLRA